MVVRTISLAIAPFPRSTSPLRIRKAELRNGRMEGVIRRRKKKKKEKKKKKKKKKKKQCNFRSEN